jgi:3-oxoacyl-[acyl-carrier-protein] synthase-3
VSRTTVYITDLAGFLPNAPVSNDGMERVLGMVAGKPSRARPITLRSNGIRTRYYAIDPATGKATHNNAALTAEAVRRLVAKSGLELAAIECLCCGTSSPDQIKPAHANMVHGELGGPPCEVVSTSGVCTSGMSALKFAYLNVASGLAVNAISTGSENASSFMRAANFGTESEATLAELDARPELVFEKDFLRWMLSDGAGAALVRNAPNVGRLSLRIDWIESLSFAGDMPVCMYSGAVLADGRLRGWREPDDRADILRDDYFAVKQDVRLLNEQVLPVTVGRALPPVARKHQLKPEDIDWFLPHYSSEYFRSRLAASMAACGFAIPFERWFTNLSEVGNVGAAAVYLILDELMYSGRLQRGERLLCYVPESARFAVSYMHLTVVA